jgi:DedD protein
MEVNGKEFLRNVGIEQDKDRLIQEQRRLEELKRASVKRDQDYMDMDMSSNEDDSAFVDLSVDSDMPQNNSRDSVEDIVLDTSKANDNKKKYIMLGFGLVLLFIITVLVIRLISNSDTENQLENSGITKQEVTKDDILNKIDSNEEYQEVIDKKNLLNEKSNVEKAKDPITDLQVPEQEADNVPLVIDTPQPKAEPKRDLFGLDKETPQAVTTVVKKVEQKTVKVAEPKVLSKPKKAVVVPPAKETNFAKKDETVSGYFVQIGAFTKEPNRSLLKTITTKGYSYKVHPVMIKERLYNKVLIGPYDSRADAVKKLKDVKIDFKNPNAYILKF